MANSDHNDSSDFTGHAAGQTPIVLARLPRVGAAPTVPASPVVFQAVPPPVAMPQLDLRTEIEQRTRLHIADTPADDPTPTTSHFADREHAVDYQPTVRLPEVRQASMETAHSRATSQRTSAKPRAAVAEPITFSEKLFRLHAQLAPHAGLIVALALIASAGLLYWMIVGPTQAPMPASYENFSESFGSELGGDGLGVTSNIVPEFTMPEFTMPEFAADTSQAAEPVSSPDDQWTEVPLPDPPQTESTHQLAQPDTKPSTLQELPSTDELLFPTTTHPHALDFTKVGPMPPSQPGSVTPLPETARRPNTTSTTR